MKSIHRTCKVLNSQKLTSKASFQQKTKQQQKKATVRAAWWVGQEMQIFSL